MRRAVIAALVLLIIAGSVWIFLQAPEQTAAPSAPATPKVLPPAPAAPNNGPVVELPVVADAVILNSASTTAADDLSHLEMLLGDYRKTFGGNPVGENEEIAAALLGRNAKRLAYLPAKGPFLNTKGELVDRWGTPYFFHALSGSRMEMRSAGPDRVMHTADDVEF